MKLSSEDLKNVQSHINELHKGVGLSLRVKLEVTAAINRYRQQHKID